MNNADSENPDFIFMVEQAIKAPSGHNTQPWLFKINEKSIEIHPNLTKSLSAVDPDNRELYISLGCATENLCIAASAKGYLSTVSISADGVILVNLIKDATAPFDSLFQQISLRQTNRSVYNGKKIADDTIAILKTVSLEKNIEMHFYVNGTSEFAAHELITERLGVPIYFTDPYCSRQKGAIENGNKLTGQNIPKKASFKDYSDEDIKKIQCKLNRRPREKLNFNLSKNEFYKQLV